MRVARYTVEGKVRIGLVEGSELIELEGDLFDVRAPTGRRDLLADVRFELPVVPTTIFAAGQNYLAHAKNYPGGKGPTTDIPTEPAIGYRAPGSLAPHQAVVRIPHDATDKVHFEGELVVVIGKEGRHIARADALDHVSGYTIGNDISERSWQKIDRTPWRAKNSDTFNTLGPWIETDFDLAAAETIVRLNGQEAIRFATADMLFGIETFISDISAYATLRPGDIIWMGTEGTSPDLKDGDLVEVEITGIGTLRNRLKRDPSPG